VPEDNQSNSTAAISRENQKGKRSSKTLWSGPGRCEVGDEKKCIVKGRGWSEALPGAARTWRRDRRCYPNRSKIDCVLHEPPAAPGSPGAGSWWGLWIATGTSSLADAARTKLCRRIGPTSGLFQSADSLKSRREDSDTLAAARAQPTDDTLFRADGIYLRPIDMRTSLSPPDG